MARGYKTKGAPGHMDQYTQAAGRAAEEARRGYKSCLQTGSCGSRQRDTTPCV